MKGTDFMFINKTVNGNNNVWGRNVAMYRKAAGLSQNKLAGLLQLCGLDIDKNAVQRIEAGKRFVTDIEIVYLADALGVTYNDLLDRTEINIGPMDRKDDTP